MQQSVLMAIDFDTSRPLMREPDFVALVEAVLTTDPSNESTWLEWKSSLDLETLPGRAHVARCILGFANRLPEAAARYCHGHAYLIVGAEPGGLQSIKRVDPAVLDDYLKPYLGP